MISRMVFPQYKNTTEATVDAMRIILQQCERSGTVKRVIHTASVTAASPLKEDGSGYKDFANESNWTPLNLSYEFSNAHLNVRNNSTEMYSNAT
jgi:hypothetical protein